MPKGAETNYGYIGDARIHRTAITRLFNQITIVD